MSARSLAALTERMGLAFSTVVLAFVPVVAALLLVESL
jgi:hypothetical protein